MRARPADTGFPEATVETALAGRPGDIGFLAGTGNDRPTATHRYADVDADAVVLERLQFIRSVGGALVLGFHLPTEASHVLVGTPSEVTVLVIGVADVAAHQLALEAVTSTGEGVVPFQQGSAEFVPQARPERGTVDVEIVHIAKQAVQVRSTQRVCRLLHAGGIGLHTEPFRQRLPQGTPHDLVLHAVESVRVGVLDSVQAIRDVQLERVRSTAVAYLRHQPGSTIALLGLARCHGERIVEVIGTRLDDAVEALLSSLAEGASSHPGTRQAEQRRNGASKSFMLHGFLLLPVR